MSSPPQHRQGSRYGNSRTPSSSPSSSHSAESSPFLSSSSPSSSSSSSFVQLLESLDSYGFDLTVMLLLFWCLVAFIVVFSLNLYLTLTKRQKRLENDATKRRNDDNRRSNDEEDEHRRSIGDESARIASTSASSIVESGRRTDRLDRNESITKWIQRVIDWLYRSPPNIINECIDAWLASLNAKSRKLTAENGICIEFCRFYRDQSAEIRFADVKVETSELNDNVLTTLKAICDRIVVQVRVAASHCDLEKRQSSLYEIVLEKFSALLKVVCKPEDSLFVARFLERPQTKVHINGPLDPSEKSFSPDLIINGMLNILTSTLVELNFCYADHFPRFHDRILASFDAAALEMLNCSATKSSRSMERKLFVTIVKANNLSVNQSKDGHEIYCSVEIDEPKEKKKTSSLRTDVTAPVWQEHFLFELNEKSREILFEVFDSYHHGKSAFDAKANAHNSNNKDECLGFGIINILELGLNPSEKLTVPLRSVTNGITGASYLEVELLLMEHKLANSSLSSEDPSSPRLVDHSHSNGTEQFTASKCAPDLTTNYFRNLSTLSNSELSTQAQYGDGSTDMKSDEQRQLDAASNGYGDRDGQISELAPTEVMGSTSRPESHASQPRESRSLIRTIRKRLSFSKRSKSVERQPNSFRERSVASVDDERARSVPGSREPSAPREMANGKKQESYLSLASNTSFFAENSTLVLECVVNGEKRHYLVPFSQANKRKYRRRKGVKLHVHNDHLFVAQHVPSSNECQVCAKSFPLRIGKQGYQCRECGFLTHKQCHALAESFCPANGAAKLNFDLDNSDTPKRVPSPLPEVRVIAPSEGSPINEKEII